jgi:alanine-glyoxylate transaminase/serine-glyoxylate transaminase/serine-pyruvate transaminase
MALSGRYPPFTPEERLLLGAGPSMVHPRVLMASSFPTVSHLDSRFVQLAHLSQELLRDAFQTANQFTLPIAGTGSAAMEAAFANLVEPGDRVLVFQNGYFGGRMRIMAEKYGGEVALVEGEWGEAFPLRVIGAAIDEFEPKVTAIVHAETSTGVAQPIEGISRHVHDSGGYLIVDAVTSLGGMPLYADDWGIDVCYSGTQKCLGAPPGLGPISVRERVLERVRGRKTPVGSWYLDMALIDDSWGKARTYPHTAPVNAIYGLYEALRMLKEERLEAAWERHAQNTQSLWAGLSDLGLELFVENASQRLPMLTAVRVPDGIDEQQGRRKLADEYGIEIAGGLGPLEGKIWRIGLMGYASQMMHVDRLLEALENVLRELKR